MTAPATRTLAAGLLVALLLAASPAGAVVVELKSGRRVEGVLRDASATRVTIEADGRSLVYEAEDVRAIYFTAAAGPPAAPGTTAPERPSLAGPDALDIMRALRASVAGGTSAREFSPRVGEASAVVERYLASAPGGQPAGGPALRDAVRYYQVAEFAWRNHSTASSTVWVRRDDVLAHCPPYREFVQAMQAKGEAYYSERTRRYILISDGVLAALWSCAADRIAEAEQVLTQKSEK